MQEERLAALLLTGGGSRRMGMPKAALRAGGQTLAGRAASLLEKVCAPVLEIGPGYTAHPSVREDPPLRGPLAAVAAGRAALERREYAGSVIVLAVDMPFVTPALLSFISRHGQAEVSAIPIVGGRPQFLCARYSWAALLEAERLAAQGATSMKSLSAHVPVQWIREAEWGQVAKMDSFADLDGRQDLQLLEELNSQTAMQSRPRRGTEETEVLTIDATGAKRRMDTVAAEEPMEIRISGPGQEPVSAAVTMRTPGHDFELAAGFLYTEGLLEPPDISSIKYCEIPREEQQYNVVTVKITHQFDSAGLHRNFYANSSCGICGKASLDQVQLHCSPIASSSVFSHSVILGMPRALSTGQRIFHKTGGLHAAGLFDRHGNLLALREDVGRHNACDKLIGSTVLSGKVPLAGHALFVSGRLSFEIVQKAARAGIPVLAAVSAPSSLAVQAARTLGITLAGFVRGEGFNVYTHPERIDPGAPR